MKMLSLKRAGIWLVLSVLMSTQGIYADSFQALPILKASHPHCKPSISRSQRIAILSQGEADWQTIISNLHEIFLIQGITGLTPATDPTIAALVAAFNGSATAVGSIFQASADFSALLQKLTVPIATAQSVETAINTFAAAGELYSAAVANGTAAEQTATLDSWVAQGVNLANILEVAIGAPIGSTSLQSLINQLIGVEVNVIQNFNVFNLAANFAVAIANQALARQLVNQISDLVLGSLIDSINHKACSK